MILLSAVLLVACGGEKTPEDEMAPPMAPAGLMAQDVAGRWNFEVMPMDRDTVLTTGTMVGAGEPLTFTQQLVGRDAMPVEVSFDGDSMMTQSGPYESVFQAGVMVTTNGVIRKVGDALEGTTTAHYAGVTTADSVVRFRVTYTRQAYP